MSKEAQAIKRWPDACGSDEVVQDIIDAAKYAEATCHVDTNRIYLIGASGGGYASLLMAARAPGLWAGVSAWVPISDIYAWWQQKTVDSPKHYAKNIEEAVGGNPDENERVDDALIDEFYRNQSLPPALVKAKRDPLYGSKTVIFRKAHENTRVTIFKGGHEIIHEAALNWLASQSKDRPTVWTIDKSQTLKTNDTESESGKKKGKP